MSSVGQIFAGRLRAARISSGYSTQKSFAEAIGEEPETYRRWERGETEPHLAALKRISRTAGVSLDLLMTIGVDARRGIGIGEEPPDGYVPVNYIETKAALGGGGYAEEDLFGAPKYLGIIYDSDQRGG